MVTHDRKSINPFVAIVIPVRAFNGQLEKCLTACLSLDYPDYEILVFPDNDFSFPEEKVRVISTGPVGPAVKRDLALKYSQAGILAFIDDDAYPEADWLKNAVTYFNNSEVAAVGGPSITPDDSSLLETAGGLVYSSLFVSGPYIYRYLPRKKRFVDDYPCCNFIIRREVFEQAGGFKNDFYPGEDTKLCLEVTQKLGHKIVYDPNVLVKHHRRPLFRRHLEQLSNYAFHRGHFFKRFPETSRKPAYMLPSLFIAYGLLGSMLSILKPAFALAFILTILSYLLIIMINALYLALKDHSRWSKPKLFLLTTAGIVLTHLTYGLYFIKGLLAGKLKEERMVSNNQAVKITNNQAPSNK